MIDEERQADAAEYVLGTLDPDAAEAVRAAARDDRELAREIYRWQDRLLPLFNRVAPASPRAETWAGLRDQLLRPLPPSRWWQSLRLWQGLVAATLVVAVGLGIQLARIPEGLETRYVAMLQTPEQNIGWIVELADANTVRLRPVGAPPELPAGRAWQFWTKPQGASKPTSLGLVPAHGVIEVPRDTLPALENQQLFEVTLEPKYGSPTGKPTGPILAVGRMVALAD